MQVKSEIIIFYINLLCNIKEILGKLKGYAHKDLALSKAVNCITKGGFKLALHNQITK